MKVPKDFVRCTKEEWGLRLLENNGEGMQSGNMDGIWRKDKKGIYITYGSSSMGASSQRYQLRDFPDGSFWIKETRPSLKDFYDRA